MSVHIMEAIYRRGPRDRTLFDVLLSLGSNADEVTGICYPSTEYTSRRTRLSTRAVLRATEQLEAEGWLRVERRAVRNTRRGRTLPGLVNRYHLNLEKIEYTPPAKPAPGPRASVSRDHRSRELQSRDAESPDSHSPDSGACESPVQNLRKSQKSSGNPSENGDLIDSLSRDSHDKPPAPPYRKNRHVTAKQQKPARLAPCRCDDGQNLEIYPVLSPCALVGGRP